MYGMDPTIFMNFSLVFQNLLDLKETQFLTGLIIYRQQDLSNLTKIMEFVCDKKKKKTF